ncbi:MAG: glycosyltransferase family 4 protein [Candidatus Omnitrophota bacterium]
MKIIFLAESYPPYISGGSLYTYEVARALALKGFNITVFARKYALGNTEYPDENQNFRISRFFNKYKSKKLNVFLGAVTLLWVLFRHRPELVVLPDLESHISGALIRLFIPFRFFSIMHCEEPIIYDKGIKRALFSFYARRADFIVTPSNYTKNQIAAHANVPLSKVFVVNPGISIEKFTSAGDSESLKKKFGLKQEKIILTLARLVDYKGQGDVIRSLPAIIKEIPDIKYVIAGRGPDYNRLQRLSRDLGLTDQVIFTGFVDSNSVNDYYELCDLFIMPSTLEGLAICFLEASAKGKPVIGSNCCGIPEAIVDGKTGILVEPHNIEQISGAIIKLLSNSELSNAFGNAGKERISSLFTWQQTTEKIYNLINKFETKN